MIKNQTSRYKTWVEVDTRALRQNFSAVQKLAGKNVSVLCVVKSNAYGHGLVETATSVLALRSFREGGWFGVDSIDEALLLKKAGIKNPILILGFIPKPRLAEAIKNGFRFALYDLDVLKESVRIAKKMRKRALVHIKVESGTYRQGVMREDVPRFADIFRTHKSILIADGIYTHFADTENSSSQYYKEQLQSFTAIVSLFEELGVSPRYRHAAASAAVLMYPETHCNMVRWGIGLYGLYASKDVQKHAINSLLIRPVLSWKTRVAQIKTAPKGATIGYDRTFTALEPMKIAVLPVGYWDGYDRRLSNKGSVLIGRKKCSIVGNICMNIAMADVTHVPRVHAGDEVVLLGRQGSEEISAEEIADKIGTINYEIITRINPLIPRVVL